MSPRCRVLVVDDEAPARRLARSLLAEMDEIEVIGDAASGQAAVDTIRWLTARRIKCMMTPVETVERAQKTQRSLDEQIWRLSPHVTAGGRP